MEKIKYIASKKYLRNMLIILHIIFSVVGFYTFFYNYNLTTNVLIQKALNKQFILAKAGSSSVETLLSNVENQLSSFIFTFTHVSESSQIDISNTRAKFIDYMKRAQLPINGIALYDENGKLVIIENRLDIRLGENQSFANAEFIKWSKNPNNREKVFVSTPYIGTAGASVGKVILIVAEPIYFGNKYKGTLAIRILVEDFSRAFITPLATGSEEESFIINSSGVVIAGRNSLLNKNLFTYAQQKKWKNYQVFSKQLKEAINNSNIQAIWTFQIPEDTKPKAFLIGMGKIDLPNTDRDLYIVVSTTQDNVISPLRILRLFGYTWLGAGLITTILGGIIVIALQSSP